MKIKVRKYKVTKPQDIANILTGVLKSEDPIDQDKEHFWGIGLTTGHQIKYLELVSVGILTESVVHPRETFRLAIHEGIDSLIVAHNHPSGDMIPSPQDKAITKRLVKAGSIIGIELLDHVIVSKDGNFFSFKQEGILNQ